jgi:predicted O-methyltransferase YrrM
MIEISQSDYEIDAFIDVLRAEGVTRFLEVGSRFGGSLDRIARSMPVGSRVVSCDSGKGMGGGRLGAQRSLRQVVADLVADGYDAHLVIGHSQLPAIVSKVKAFGPYDAVFIDGDHQLKGVTQDWENYGTDAAIVGFHDIAWREPEGFPSYAKKVEVPALWARLREQFEHHEFIDHEYNYGIGVLWT